MKLFGITGWKNAGKTTLMVALVGLLTARGLRVATVKHAHHNFDIDHEGKDSFRHRMAGATEVIVSSASRWALIHENRGQGADEGADEEEARLEDLLAHLSPDIDLVLVEGFKSGAHEKIQVYRGQENETLLAPQDKSVVAVATDQQLEGVLTLPLDDPGAIADFILARVGLN
ncbi:MAG: molybdopterin-guanine dinucleotide biosynthesis protein B [Proteobacteria bacterium]|nr:molybdopterin-guanine dinucleotide biosynthesis protein B [Pseudomonadota bacterium]